MHLTLLQTADDFSLEEVYSNPIHLVDDSVITITAGVRHWSESHRYEGDHKTRQSRHYFSAMPNKIVHSDLQELFGHQLRLSDVNGCDRKERE